MKGPQAQAPSSRETSFTASAPSFIDATERIKSVNSVR